MLCNCDDDRGLVSLVCGRYRRDVCDARMHSPVAGALDLGERGDVDVLVPVVAVDDAVHLFWCDSHGEC